MTLQFRKLSTIFHWRIILAEVNIIDDGCNYLLQIGYACGSETPYLRVWGNDDPANIDFICGCWLDIISNNDYKTEITLISPTLKKEIIKQAERIEKLKAFV